MPFPSSRASLPGVDLTHEVLVSKIAAEEVEYVIALGLTRDEATATIVTGFLHIDIEGLPPEFAAELRQAVEISEKELF